MRILVIGSGAREHALAWKIAQSPTVTALTCVPGNPGTRALRLRDGTPVQNVEGNPEDPQAMVALATGLGVELAVVGPEAPLVAGVADALRAAGVPVFGPDRKAARIEGSKAFAKDVMIAAGVPTPGAKVFHDRDAALAQARNRSGGVVVKADGLAGGKGVVVADDAEQAVAAVEALSALGAAGAWLLLEERVSGEEVSVIALCDGERYLLLPPAQDHKRLLDGDRGPNTGGMGAFCPSGTLEGPALDTVGERVIAPVLAELARRGCPFRGALYAGLMLTPQGPQVLEFNCRFGDPEAQVLMLQLGEDLVPLLWACATGALSQKAIRELPGASVGVVLASEGYPQDPKNGAPIFGLPLDPAEATVFHAGTRELDGALVTSGGRVLTVCARGASLAQARERAYAAAGRIHFPGMQLRRDIGAKGTR